MARCQGPGNGGAKGGGVEGVWVRGTKQWGPTLEPRGARSPHWPRVAAGAGARGELSERSGAQASSAIHSCTEARAELLLAAIVTRGRCGSRASTLARDKWPLTAPPRQESSSDFTARQLSGLCLARFPVRTFKSASRPSLLLDAVPRPPRPWQGPGRVEHSLGLLPTRVGVRWGLRGDPEAARGGG